jgi:hypothetical protein
MFLGGGIVALGAAVLPQLTPRDRARV